MLPETRLYDAVLNLLRQAPWRDRRHQETGVDGSWTAIEQLDGDRSQS